MSWDIVVGLPALTAAAAAAATKHVKQGDGRGSLTLCFCTISLSEISPNTAAKHQEGEMVGRSYVFPSWG